MPNWIKPTLTKGIILQKNSLREYLVKDVFSQKEITVHLTGQETMLYSYEKEDIVYVAESEQTPGKGKLMTPTGLKYNPFLNSLKAELDKKHEAYLKTNTKETK